MASTPRFQPPQACHRPSHLDELLSRCGQQVRSIVKDAVDLRRRGQYYESSSLLLHLPRDILEQPALQNEIALTYVYQDNFEKVLDLVGSCSQLGSNTKGAAFSKLLVAYTRLHVDMMLHEAVLLSQEVWKVWLDERPLEEYDDLDVHMVCLYHMLQELGRRLLGNDEWETLESPAEASLKQLRRYLLKVGHTEEILIVLQTEHWLCPAHLTISNLLETLRLYPSAEQDVDETPEKCQDVVGWIRILLSGVFHTSSQMSECNEQLHSALGIFEQSKNGAGCLWAELQSVVTTNNDVHQPGMLEKLARKFTEIEDYKGVQVCKMTIARIYQKKDDPVQYHSTLMSALEIAVGRMASASSQVAVSGPLSDRGKDSILRQNRGSMFTFWQTYTGLMPSDLKHPRYLGIALDIASQFFILHPDCSIPHLQFSLAMELSDLYSDRIGDASMALKWASEATHYASATGADDVIADAQSRFRVLLTGRGVVVTNDPHGFKSQEWHAAQMRDLEFAFQEAGESEHWEAQISYARKLMALQLSAEVQAKKTVCGEPWLSEATRVLRRLPDDRRIEEKHAIDTEVAYAIFESGDFKRAASAISRSIEEYPAKDPVLMLHTLFTLGRIHLQAYRETQTQTYWGDSYQVFESVAHSAMVQQRPDLTGCCHCMIAELWRLRGVGHSAQALHHISEAERLWSKERESFWNLDGLGALLTRLSLRHRNESGPTDVFAIAYDACFESRDFVEAWKWAQKAKARAYAHSLGTSDERKPFISPDPDTSGNISFNGDIIGSGSDINLHWLRTASGNEEGIVCVDWVTAEDTIYMITFRIGAEPLMHKLDISLRTVMLWYSDLCNTNDDLRGEDAEETLADLDPLCAPLLDPLVSRPGELLLLCPTKILSKIALHALNVGDEILLARNPIVYMYNLAVLKRCFRRLDKVVREDGMRRIMLFGNPTGDTPGGTRSVSTLSKFMDADSFTEDDATMERFVNACLSSKLVHYHGHVSIGEHPLNHAMIFGDSRLNARHVASMKLQECCPLISMIACGSGTEQLRTGDEPLGLVSSFIYAGASTVLATLWPINDTLSGEPFSQTFYEEFNPEDGDDTRNKVIDLARALQKAALKIRSQTTTKAPYFWAGYVLHGRWTFEL